jgi:hypothetical protein
VANLEYLGMKVRYQNLIHEETKSRSHLGNACYQSVQNLLLPSRLLYKTVKMKILRDEHKLKVFENRVLKRDEVTRGWRKMHNEELHNLYSSQSIIRMIKSRRMRWAGNVALKGEKGNAYRILVGKPEGKKPLKRPRHRWEDNIKMERREIGLGGMDWIHLV